MNKTAATEKKREKPAESTPRRVDSDQLLGTAGELIIVHMGREYRLRRTQNDKLILTA